MILLQTAIATDAVNMLAEKGITFLLLGVAIWYFYRKESDREKREDERHKSIEDRFLKLQEERALERIQIVAFQAEMTEVIKDNTTAMRELKLYIENDISSSKKNIRKENV